MQLFNRLTAEFSSLHPLHLLGILYHVYIVYSYSVTAKLFRLDAICMSLPCTCEMCNNKIKSFLI